MSDQTLAGNPWNANQKRLLNQLVAKLRNRAARPPYTVEEVLDWFSDYDPYENLADLAQPPLNTDDPKFADLVDASEKYVLSRMVSVIRP